MGKAYYLLISSLLHVCSSAVFAENVANISDSLAVETNVDTVKVISSVAPTIKSKTDKRDSSDQIGPTAFTLKENQPFGPVNSATYQQLPAQPQQIQPSPTSITFQPTTTRYVAEEAAPQAYYGRPPNIRPHDGPANGGKYSNFVGDSIHYGTPINSFRGPFKGPYQQQLEQTHPQPQQQQYHQKQQHNQQQHAAALKPPPRNSYSPSSAEGGFIPSERQLQQEQPPQHYRQQHTHTQQQQQNEPYSQQLQQQQPYVALEKQPQPQQYQQQQQQQYHQPSRQQIHYIIAIPLSYVRQLQYQLAAQQVAPPPPPPPAQHQQQAPPPAPLPLAAPRAPLPPPLLVLSSAGAGGDGSGSGGGGGGSTSSLSRELYRTQPPIHYVPHAPAPAQANLAAGPHVQSPAALLQQQLPFPMNLALTALARPRPAVYPASQLLYVQPQLIRHTPHQQLQLQVKQPHHLPHYAHASDQQQTHAIEERNTQQSKHSQPQQQTHQGPDRSGTKPKVSQVLPPSSASPSPSLAPPQVTTALPLQSPLPAAAPVLFYGPTFVQPPQAEQHPLPPFPYASYFQGQFGPAQHAATLVKLSSPSALLPPQTALVPHYYHIQPPPVGPPPFAAALSPQSLLVAKAPLQLQQSSHQHEPPALSAFTSRPAVYVAPHDAVDSIGGASWSEGGLPYFIHPAGVHYGTHRYHPGTPLAAQKLLENVDNQQQQQQQLRPEPDRKHQQQQLGSTATSGGNDDNNAIVKYP